MLFRSGRPGRRRQLSWLKRHGRPMWAARLSSPEFVCCTRVESSPPAWPGGKPTATRHPIRKLLTFLRDESGPTAVEYAVMLALIVVICLASITVLGRTSRRDFRVVGRSLSAGS